MKLPRSRVNDGVCDCCDGTDEPSGSCPDICNQVLAKQRAARVKAQQEFTKGYAKRNQELAAFQIKVVETKARIAKLQDSLATVDTLTVVEEQIQLVKQQYMAQRILKVGDIVKDKDLLSVLDPLSNNELESFIWHACQMAGEMDGGDDNNDTCSPFRLAALDMAIIFGDDNYDNPEQITMTRGLTQDLSEKIYENALADKQSSSSKENATRRRLMEEDNDSDSDDDYRIGDDYDDDYMGDAHDYMGGDTAHDHHHHDDDHEKKAETVLVVLEGKRQEMVNEFKDMLFSKTRVAFTARSKQLSEEISKLLEADDQEKEREEEEESAEGEEESAEGKEGEESAEKIDPIAFTMVKSNLGRKEKAIERGFRYGASAKLLLDIFKVKVNFGADKERDRKELLGLASGTIYHGGLASKHVWQILQAILPEFSKALGEATQEQTCASPWAGSCPPKSVTRESFTIPPDFLMSSAVDFCAEQVNEALQGACAADSGDGVPTSIPEGYYGYSSVTARSGDDLLTKVFAALDALQLDRTKLEALEKEKADLEQSKKDVEKEMTELFAAIGGKNGNKLGPNGELAVFKDACFSVTAGKYIYEACPFKKSHQKDRDSPKGGGTYLGQWKRMDFDEESGQRIMRWEDGAKCWNGPSRSATAYVTCGAETKVLSADEPDTCRYVLQMESHIACDDAYKAKFGF